MTDTPDLRIVYKLDRATYTRWLADWFASRSGAAGTFSRVLGLIAAVVLILVGALSLSVHLIRHGVLAVVLGVAASLFVGFRWTLAARRFMRITGFRGDELTELFFEGAEIVVRTGAQEIRLPTGGVTRTRRLADRTEITFASGVGLFVPTHPESGDAEAVVTRILADGPGHRALPAPSNPSAIRLVLRVPGFFAMCWRAVLSSPEVLTLPVSLMLGGAVFAVIARGRGGVMVLGWFTLVTFVFFLGFAWAIRRHLMRLGDDPRLVYELFDGTLRYETAQAGAALPLSATKVAVRASGVWLHFRMGWVFLGRSDVVEGDFDAFLRALPR